MIDGGYTYIEGEERLGGVLYRGTDGSARGRVTVRSWALPSSAMGGGRATVRLVGDWGPEGDHDILVVSWFEGDRRVHMPLDLIDFINLFEPALAVARGSLGISNNIGGHHASHASPPGEA